MGRRERDLTAAVVAPGVTERSEVTCQWRACGCGADDLNEVFRYQGIANTGRRSRMRTTKKNISNERCEIVCHVHVSRRRQSQCVPATAGDLRDDVALQQAT